MKVALNLGLAHSDQFRLIPARSLHGLNRHTDSLVETTASPTRFEHGGPSGSDFDSNCGQAQVELQAQGRTP